MFLLHGRFNSVMTLPVASSLALGGKPEGQILGPFHKTCAGNFSPWSQQTGYEQRDLDSREGALADPKQVQFDASGSTLTRFRTQRD